jgi:hypothetical protein
LDSNETEYTYTTEYEGMNIVEEVRRENDITCQFCNSDNVEVFDISVDNYRLYDYERLADTYSFGELHSFFMINIDKEGNTIELSTGGNLNLRAEFLEEALKKMLIIVRERPIDNFKLHQKGNFLMCVSGGYDFDKNRYIIQVEKFRTVGLSIREITKGIESLALKYNIEIPDDPF